MINKGRARKRLHALPDQARRQVCRKLVYVLMSRLGEKEKNG